MSATLPKRDKVLSPRINNFLTHFANTVFTYIADNGELPVIHSELLDLKRQDVGYGIFFSVNGFSGNQRNMEHLTNINGFFIDVDYPDKLDPDPKKIQQYKNEYVLEFFDMESKLPEPTAIVGTKNGLHVYWVLETPIYLSELNEEQQKACIERYLDIEKALVKRFDGDQQAKDIPRVLRVPGSMHLKDPANPFECELIHYNKDMVYKFSEIRDAFLVQAPPNRWATVAAENTLNQDVKQKIEESYPKLSRPSYKSLLERTIDEATMSGKRNKSLLIIATACRESGWSMTQTLEHFGDNFYGLSLREIRRTIQSAYDHVYDFGYNNEVMSTIVVPEERVELSKAASKTLAKEYKEKRTESAKKNEEQKEMFLSYERIIAERHPYLKYKKNAGFYNYKDGVYIPMSREEIQSLFLRHMESDGLMNYRKNSCVGDKMICFRSIEDRMFTQEDENNRKNIINLKNGLLDLDTGELSPHTPDYLSTIQIPIAYDKTANAPRWKQFVDEVMCGDGEQGKLLQEIAGYSLTADTNFSKAFIFYGSGANGKSLFNRILSHLVGKENTSSVTLASLNQPFGLTGIMGKRLNLIDEISGNYFESNMIKTIISGERLSANIKHSDPVEFVPTVKLIFSVNEMPKINDTTQGLYRRFIIIPFERSFLDSADLMLEAKLTNELPGVLNWALQGLMNLRQNGRFNETEKNRTAMSYFKIENSPLVEFITERYEPIPEGFTAEKASMTTRIFYETYRRHCMESGSKPKAFSNFMKEMNHMKIDGYNCTIEIVDKVRYVMGIRDKFDINGHQIMYNDNPPTI